MGSSEQSSLRKELTPFLAIMQADLKSVLKSKITYAWLVAAIFLQVIRVFSSSFFGTTSSIITQGLSDFIYIWSMLIIGLTASAISSDSGELADSIMSKSVRRYDYILAKFSSRIIYVLVIFSLTTGVLTETSIKMVSNDYELYGLVSAILFVALALIMLTTLGVAFSTLIPNTVIAIVSLLVLWYSMTFFFPILDLALLSPSNLINELPNIIQGIWNGEEWKIVAGFTIISLVSVAGSSVYFTIKDL